MKKILSILLMNLLISAPIHAKTIARKSIHFQIDTESLVRGDVHYAIKILSPDRFRKQFSKFYPLDTLGLLREKNEGIFIAKSAFIVNKPAGFFDHEKIKEKKFLQVSDNYKINAYFDSDEISTLPNARITGAVTQTRKLDVLAQSASSIYLIEKSQLTKNGEKEIKVSSYVPLKENKTLVLEYTLGNIKKQSPPKKKLLKNFVDEIYLQKNLINKY